MVFPFHPDHLGFPNTSAAARRREFCTIRHVASARLPPTDLAENASHSGTGAARRPRCDGPTLPSSDLAFEGLGLLFANRSTATILALAISETVGGEEDRCRDGRAWSL